MSWMRDGQKVSGKYMGQSFAGIIVSTRTKYGIDIQHKVKLTKPIEVFGEVRSDIFVNESDKNIIFEKKIG
jgi:hypothetical protein